ncbi:DEAD/DEAH box helicase family protein, partial [Clostridium sporogenes]|uniref:DEAD/DEAH box helicase family protein n=1 Tax=Clostridium sporogenes TaxID=1509 RepID=UPI00313EE575
MSYQQEAVDGLNSYADVQKPGSLQSGLLVMPAGTGKTYMSAFDVINYNPKRMLFLVNREEILKSAKKT